jgi:hypothetical protein
VHANSHSVFLVQKHALSLTLLGLSKLALQVIDALTPAPDLLVPAPL